MSEVPTSHVPQFAYRIDQGQLIRGAKVIHRSYYTASRKTPTVVTRSWELRVAVAKHSSPSAFDKGSPRWECVRLNAGPRHLPEDDRRWHGQKGRDFWVE
ncbi:hypothetical protein M8818_005375 [Zalaria obscura]|uniref:Uncharacterized protein n=1 Tax=Zalaria obscura TaxID=2024903 RepID=A0ACC3SAY6_9PEZI